MIDKLKLLLGWLTKSIADNYIGLFLAAGGAATIWAYLRPTPHRIKKFFLATYSIEGWVLLIAVLVCAVGVILSVKRLVLWYQTKHLQYTQKELFGFKWEVSSQFYNDGFRVSVEKLKPAFLNLYIKGPL
jgi:hypothetical protein